MLASGSDDRTVRVFNRDMEQLRSFAKRPKGQFSHSLGARGRRTTTMEQDMAWWIQRCAAMGTNCGLWAIEVMAERDAPGIRSLQGLLALRKKHTTAQIEQACERALGKSAFRLADIKAELDRPQQQTSFTFMDKHPLIRDMDEYAAILDQLCGEELLQEAGT